jgi:hypothetical protein
MPGRAPINAFEFAVMNAKNAAGARQRAANIEAAKPAIQALQAAARDDFDKEALRLTVMQVQAGQLAPDAIGAFFEKARKEVADRTAHKENARTVARNQGAGLDLRRDAANRGDVRTLQSDIREALSEADSKTLIKSNRALHAAMANIAAKGPDAVMSHKDAFVQLERYFRGGTPTDSETHLLLSNLGGIPGAVDRFLAESRTGDFSDITKRNIVAATRRALAEHDENVNNMFAGLRERFGPGSGYDNMAPQVNRRVHALGRTYGLDLPPVYETEGEGVTLGSGKRPAGGKSAPAPKTAGRKSAEDWAKEYAQ